MQEEDGAEGHTVRAHLWCFREGSMRKMDYSNSTKNQSGELREKCRRRERTPKQKSRKQRHVER